MGHAGWSMNLSVGSTPVAASSYFSVWHPRHTLKWCLASSAKLAGIYRVYRATHSCILQMNGRVSSPPGRTALPTLRWRQPWRNTTVDLVSPHLCAGQVDRCENNTPPTRNISITCCHHPGYITRKSWPGDSDEIGCVNMAAGAAVIRREIKRIDPPP
ncbi:uncharacterized protein LOC144902788 [Branchiostoma floridae x Branchiostoma belcheri]